VVGEGSGSAREDAGGRPEELVLEIRREPDGTVVRLAGEVDLYNAPHVREALLEVAAELPSRLVVDLSEVEFIDSTAMAVLIEVRATMTDSRALVLAAPALGPKRALEISGLDRHFTIRDSVSEALAASLDT
jgi:anti-sigma B factor antagonist